jgi:hypothetical protein
MHRAYAKHAEVTVPSLSDWEKAWERKTEDKNRWTETGIGETSPRPSLLPTVPAYDRCLPIVFVAQAN